MEEIIKSIVEKIQEKISKKTPEIAIILGSGLSEVADNMEEKVEIPFESLKGMPITTVKGHKNSFVFGKINGKYVIAMKERFHLYERFYAKQVVMPSYIFKLLGVKTLIVTNASGGVNRTFVSGDVMLITDH